MASRPGHGADIRVRLLLVDRDPTAGRMTAEALSGCLEPDGLEQALGGKHAAELLRTNSYDVVLIDLMSLGELAQQTEEAVARLVKLADGALMVALSDGAR